MLLDFALSMLYLRNKWCKCDKIAKIVASLWHVCLKYARLIAEGWKIYTDTIFDVITKLI